VNIPHKMRDRQSSLDTPVPRGFQEGIIGVPFLPFSCYTIPTMIISYHGGGCIKAVLGDRVVAFNPVSKDADSKASRFGADVALISLNDPLYNGVDQIAAGGSDPFVAAGPGEYEVGGVFIRGVLSEGPNGKVNTIYSVLFEEIRLCHLGAIATGKVSPEAMEAIGEVDVLFVPTNADLLSGQDAHTLATSLEPKLVIPLHYGSTGTGSGFQQFLKEEGTAVPEMAEKFTFKKKDLDGKEFSAVYLANVDSIQTTPHELS